MSVRSDYLPVGKVTGLFGVRGWLKVWSWTSPPDRLLSYSPLYRRHPDGDDWVPFELKDKRSRGNGFIVLPADCETRDEAALYRGCEIGVGAEQLPETEEGEYYWYQLQGLEVRTRQRRLLGRVTGLLATGANDVLVVESDKGRTGKRRRHLIPWRWRHVILEVDLSGGRIVVDWDDGGAR